VLTHKMHTHHSGGHSAISHHARVGLTARPNKLEEEELDGWVWADYTDEEEREFSVMLCFSQYIESLVYDDTVAGADPTGATMNLVHWVKNLVKAKMEEVSMPWTYFLRDTLAAVGFGVDAGHRVPQQLGGAGGLLNMIPQSARDNRHEQHRQSEMILVANTVNGDTYAHRLRSCEIIVWRQDDVTPTFWVFVIPATWEMKVTKVAALTPPEVLAIQAAADVPELNIDINHDHTEITAVISGNENLLTFLKSESDDSSIFLGGTRPCQHVLGMTTQALIDDVVTHGW